MFDTAYTYRIMRERSLFALVTGRSLGGYFDHVWTVHPVAGLLEPEGSETRWGRPDVRDIAPGHSHVEGKLGRFEMLRRFQTFDFLLAQLSLTALLASRLNRRQIKVVRAEDAHYNGLLAWLWSIWFRAPLVVGVWGNPDKGRAQANAPLMPRLFRKIWIERAVEGFVLRRAAMVVVQCEDERDYAIARGVPTDRIQIFGMSNLLDEAHWEGIGKRRARPGVLAELNLESKETLLCVSRLERVKLLDQVVLVLKHLFDRGRDVVLIVAGAGSAQRELDEQSRQLGIAERLFFVGDRTQKWLARAYPEVSVVLAPYTGRALAEAALGGAAVVAYDVEWHAQFIESGVTGEIVPFMDHVAMADAVERFLDNREYARFASSKIRERTLKLLDPTIANQMQIEAYESLIKSSAPQ